MVVRSVVGPGVVDPVVCCGLMTVMVRTGGVVFVASRKLSLCLCLGLCAGRRALHGNRQRSPYGEQHGEQQKEPDAKRLHSC